MAYSEIQFDLLGEFCAAIKREGITKLVCAEINEKRSVQTEPTVLIVRDVKQIDILAYKDSVIYKCSIADADFDATYMHLESNGFEITRRNRNIT
jgi:hypothetical protein